MATKAAAVINIYRKKYIPHHTTDVVEMYNDIHYLLTLLEIQDRCITDIVKQTEIITTELTL